MGSTLVKHNSENENVIVPQGNEKLSFWTKVSYGLGEFSGSVVWSLVSSYLLFFYTDVFGLAGGVAAVILLIARVWDCFVDPLLGLVMERTNTKYGRFRPYLLIGSVGLVIFNILTFYTPSFSDTGKIIYACITYLLLGTFHSMVSVPYGTLATVMTRDSLERTKLNSFRGFFGQIAGIITGAAVMPLVMFLGQGNDQNGYFYASIVLSLISLPMLFITFKNCKEVITLSKEEKPNLKESLQAVVLNKQFLLVLTTLFLLFTGLFGRLGTLVYYCMYVLKRPDLIAVFFTILSICMAVAALLPAYLEKVLEKKTILKIGLSITGVSFIAIYFTPTTNIPMLIALTILASLPLGFNGIMIFGMTADCIDDNQLKTGVRSDGAIYSFTSLTTKISNAIIGSLSLAALGFFGYVANAEQTPEALNGINIVVNLVPGILFLLATIPMYFYKITKERAGNTARELEARRGS